VHVIPKGVDPGWDYNPGEAAWGRNEALRLMEGSGIWKDLESWGPSRYGRPEKIAVDEPEAKPWAPPDRAEQALREALRRAIGGDEVTFTDPANGNVMITQAIVDHMLAKPGRIDGREAYFPLIPELVRDPFEIWINFARNEISGRVGVRKRYVKAVQLDRKTTLGLWAETMDGQWVSGDFFRGGITGAQNMRRGRLLWGRE
jgi:hypothetical protein